MKKMELLPKLVEEISKSRKQQMYIELGVRPLHLLDLGFTLLPSDPKEHEAVAGPSQGRLLQGPRF